MTRVLGAAFLLAISLAAQSGVEAQDRLTAPRWVGEYDAQALAGAPVTQPAVLRNFGPVDVGGGGTRVGNGDQPAVGNGRPLAAGNEGQPAVDTTLYPNYYNPSFVGYHSFRAGNYASYAGFGYGGHPLGLTNYPPFANRSRYLYPYRYYPLRTGFSVYNPQFYYGNSYYGRYASPFWTGYGGFGFPYHFGAFGAGGAGGAGYTFGGFGYPYRYGIFGYPYGVSNLTYSYMPSPAYFMYPGMGGLYVPPGFVGFPGYFGYGSYGRRFAPNYAGAFFW